MARRLRWIVAGSVVALVALAAAAALLVGGHPPAAPSDAAVIAEFRRVEHQCLQEFNTALHRQGANEIDELGLADVIDRDVLPPWRAMRAHVEAARVPPAHRALFAALHDYLEDRQIAWEAFSAALRAPSDAAARPHYAAYHDKNTAATHDAQVVAPLLPR